MPAVFTLDTSTLGGNSFNYAENPEIEDRGRSISVTWSQSGLNQDMEIFGYSIRYKETEKSPKEQV